MISNRNYPYYSTDFQVNMTKLAAREITIAKNHEHEEICLSRGYNT